MYITNILTFFDNFLTITYVLICITQQFFAFYPLITQNFCNHWCIATLVSGLPVNSNILFNIYLEIRFEFFINMSIMLFEENAVFIVLVINNLTVTDIPKHYSCVNRLYLI